MASAVGCWQWQAALLTFLWQAALLNDFVGRRRSPFFFAFVEELSLLRFPLALQGVQQLLIFSSTRWGGRGDWGLGPFLRSMDDLWLTILRRGTFWDFSAQNPSQAKDNNVGVIAAGCVPRARLYHFLIRLEYYSSIPISLALRDAQ